MALVEIGPRFWNIRGNFKIKAGLIDIGNHMSIIGLSNGRFLIVDALILAPETKRQIDLITDNGTKIEGVLATHPFHTLGFPSFYNHYPNAPYYGTPRHLRTLSQIRWAGDLSDCNIRNKWSPEVEMRIPDGAEFVAPVPEKSNHFSCVFVYHRQSRTLHVDDTIFYSSNPGLLLKIAGYRHGDMSFHPTLKSVGLFLTPEAPYQFRDFIRGILNDWDFDSICLAHMGYKIGGAKQQLANVLESASPLFDKLSERNKRREIPLDEGHSHNVDGNECG